MNQQAHGFRTLLVSFASAMVAIFVAEFVLKFVMWPSLLETLLGALALVGMWRLMQLAGWLPPRLRREP